jgi:hypothetical protein
MNVHEEILAWYDGYSWDGETKVINPFSLLSKAMSQIEERGYCKPYIGLGKKVFQAAFAFLGRDDIEMRAFER